MVTPQVDAGIPHEDGEVVALLKTQLADLRADRDHWRQAAEHQMTVAEQERAERLALTERLLLTDQRPSPDQATETPSTDPLHVNTGDYAEEAPRSFWSRLFGRS